MISAASQQLKSATEIAGRVPDPEIPWLTLADLGIVRGVRMESDQIVVTMTPTYSGCPATEVIEFHIVAALEAAGYSPARVERSLRPPWTTDWITPHGRAKLAEVGIAPPGPAGPSKAVPVALRPRGSAAVPGPACPRCASSDTVIVSQFGSTVCKGFARCRSCAEPFDYFKPI